MKAAVIVARNPEYRLLAPVIDAALARGWSVECWHDYGQPQDGSKGYQFASTSTAPRFVNGQPRLRTYENPAQLQALLDREHADVLITAGTSQSHGQVPTERRLTWASLQYVVDSFVSYPPERLLASDVLAIYSQWWIRWAGEYFESQGLVADRQDFESALQEKAALVGLPELDATRLIDPDEVRRRWGIPPRQPVVVLLPFGQGTGRAAFWPRRICGEPNRFKQAVNMVAAGRFEYWPAVMRGWNDARVVKALRTFCDRNGAYLVVKSRRKTPIPAYTEAVADKCLYDESFYPATILEALSIASLCVSYYSGAVLEAIPLGVPHACVTFEADDYFGGTDSVPAHFGRFFTTEEGDAFKFRGVSSTFTISEAIDRLPAMSLQDFAMNTDAQARYVEKFLTRHDGTGAARTLDAIERVARA